MEIDKFLKVDHLSKEAVELRDFMSTISEDKFCAVWHTGLEYKLWSFLNSGPRLYEGFTITQETIDRLTELSNKCSGWIIFNESTYPKCFHLIPLKIWNEHYNQPQNFPLKIADLYIAEDKPSKLTGLFEEGESSLIKRNLLLFDDLIEIDLPKIDNRKVHSHGQGGPFKYSYTIGGDGFGFQDYQEKKYKWLQEKNLIKKYEVSFLDAKGSGKPGSESNCF